MGKMKDLYSIMTGAYEPRGNLPDGTEWFNSRNKKMYVVKNGKLKIKEGE